MGKLTFPGGIHPNEGKKLTMDKPVVEYLPKGDCVYPLSQHIGAPAVPIVKKGDRVLAGQKIAEAAGFVSANIHASISGTVKVIEPRMTSSGSKVNSIVIENDGLFESVDYSQNKMDLETLYRDDVRNIIKEAGIVGMGGAGFPANVKLTPKNEDEIDYIIVNGAECEPYLTSDYRRMIEEPEKLIHGLEICINLFDNAKGIIAIEDNKPEAIKLLRELTKDKVSCGKQNRKVKDLLERANVQSPVTVEMRDGTAEITLEIVAAFGARIPAVAEKVQENVKSAVQNMTNVTVSRVDLVIAGLAPAAEPQA